MQRNLDRQEQRLLLASASTTLALSIIGISVGIWTGAKSIVFDGMYDTIDAGMTATAWFAARMIAKGDDRRFQFGYWHLEPILAFLNGAVLLFACIYAFVDGISALLMGGRTVSFNVGFLYAVAGTGVSFAIYRYVSRRSKGLNSTLLDLDAQAWLLGGMLSAGLSLSFAVAGFMDFLGVGKFAAYVDPVILILLSTFMAVVPIRTIVKAGREILQIAPLELDARVSLIAAEVAKRHGFIQHRSYVMKVGRAEFVEIGFVASSATTSKTLGELDEIRLEIANSLGGVSPNKWLTLIFTADQRWI